MKIKKLAAGLVCFALCGVIAFGSAAQNETKYSYDALGRLTAVCNDGADVVTNYQFDGLGNRSVAAASSSCDPTFSISDASADEGGVLSFVVSRSGLGANANSVDYATSDISASSSSDYTADSGTLTFSAGQSAAMIEIQTSSDSDFESNETLHVTLSNATGGATITGAQGTGTIANDDDAPAFSISNASAIAGGGLTFTITKSGSTTLSHAVSYATANGTAIAGTHYTAKSGMLTFTSGQTSKNVTVSTTSGSVTSGSKSMVVNLSDATAGAVISDSQGTGTITANHAPNAVNDTVSGTHSLFEQVTVDATANDTDADNDSLSVTAASCVSSGCSASHIGESVFITGTTAGTKTVNYTISDGHGGTDSATITALYVDDCPYENPLLCSN